MVWFVAPALSVQIVSHHLFLVDSIDSIKDLFVAQPVCESCISFQASRAPTFSLIFSMWMFEESIVDFFNNAAPPQRLVRDRFGLVRDKSCMDR